MISGPVALFTDVDMSTLKSVINSGISERCPHGIWAGIKRVNKVLYFILKNGVCMEMLLPHFSYLMGQNSENVSVILPSRKVAMATFLKGRLNAFVLERLSASVRQC